MKIRVLLADDHALLRQGLRALLEQESDIEVVAEVGDGRTVVRQSRELRPDVVVMDLGMPGLNGIEATRRIRQENTEVRIVGLSMHTSQRMVLEMLRAGADGYVAKLSAFEEVVRAVRAVIRGERYLGPLATSAVVERAVSSTGAEESPAFSLLTSREREVLQAIAEGRNTKEIGGTLGISPRTVEVHRKHVMEKLDLHNVAELTRFALREGLITLDPSRDTETS